MAQENAGNSSCGGELSNSQYSKGGMPSGVASCDGGRVKLEKKAESKVVNWKTVAYSSYYSAPSDPVAWEELKSNLETAS